MTTPQKPLILTISAKAVDTVADTEWSDLSITYGESDGSQTVLEPSMDKCYPLVFEDGKLGDVEYDQVVVTALVNDVSGDVFLVDHNRPGGASKKIAVWVTPHSGKVFNFMVRNPSGGTPLDPKLLIRNLPPRPPTPATSPPPLTSLSQLQDNELLVSAPGVLSGCVTNCVVSNRNLVVLNSHIHRGLRLTASTSDYHITSSAEGSLCISEVSVAPNLQELYWGDGNAGNFKVNITGDGMPVLAVEAVPELRLYVNKIDRRCAVGPEGAGNEDWVQSNSIALLA